MLTCENRSPIPSCFTTATVSPPPRIVVAPFRFATASASRCDPRANASNSITPIGPFHTTVRHPSSALAYSFSVVSPASMIRQPSGTSRTDTCLACASAANSSATVTSVGSSSVTPFSFARVITCRACSRYSSSTSDSPTSMPSALKNVFAMPPPMSSLSTRSSRLSSTPIFVLTFAPPMIAA